jgi:hypothetical protein
VHGHREERASDREVMTMTALEVPGTGFDPRTLLGLGLPAHVFVQLDDRWQPAWLIGRLHCADGWVALIQYTGPGGAEHTRRVPADRVNLSTP